MTEQELKALPDALQELFEKLERRTVDRICARIKDIGELTASDAQKLIELSRIGYDVDNILKDIAETTAKAEDEIYSIFSTAAKADYEFQKSVYEKLGKTWVPFDEHSQMQKLVESITRITAGELANITRTTGFVGDLSGTKKVLPHWKELSEYYQDVVDYATLQIRTGVKDYHSVMRSTVRELSDNGLSYPVNRDGSTVIEYDNENKRYYRRRVDSSVRVAVNGGLQRLSRTQSELIAAEIGADGMEITWHSGARPSHVGFAGKQYPMKEYEAVCVPLLDDFNCYHRAFPIVLGVSTPTHSRAELDKLNAKDAELHTFEGKTYDMHDATQMQRKLETAIRQQKDRAKAFGKAGDADAERNALVKASALNAKYKAFSKEMGLPIKGTRVTSGLSRSQAGQLGYITRVRNSVAATSGTVTRNGIIAKATGHAADQAVVRQVKASSIVDALTNPLHISTIRADRTQQFIGASATVAINVDNGNMATVWKTSTARIKKYGGDG